MAHRVLTGVLVPITLGALVLSVIAFSRTSATHPTMTRAARTELRSLSDEVTRLQSEEAKLSSRTAKGGGKLSSTVARIEACLPELTSYVNGLTPTVSNGSVYLNNDQQISAYCSKLLYGGGTGP